MALNHSPKTITDGLVFFYDSNNPRSFLGAPVVNSQWNNGSEVTIQTVGTGLSTVTDVTGTSEAGPVIGAKTWRVVRPGGANTIWNGWETTAGGTWTGSSGDIWTTSYWYRTTNSAGQGGFGVGAFYLSDWSRAYSTTILSNRNTIIADGEWRFNYTTVQINEAYTNAIIVDGPSWPYSNTAGVMYINGLQWNKNAYSAPFAGGTRTTANCMFDIVGGSSMTATNLTYPYDSQTNIPYSFNGTNNCITIANNTALDTQTPTVEVWIKTNALTQNGFWFEKGLVNTQYSLFQEGGNIVWRQKFSGGITSLTAASASYLNTSNWFQIVGTYTSGTRVMYINGVPITSDTQTGTIDTNSGGMTIGSYNSGAYYFNGNIAIVKVYNRALSAAEVKQNFNALRGRFGV